MSVKSYYLRFGTRNPATYSGLSPTFIVWGNALGVTTPPAISEISGTGIYSFDYECNGTVAFVCDGATTGIQAADRYVAGSLDISDRIDEFTGKAGDIAGFSSLYGQVLSNVTNIGTTADPIGDNLTDPTTLFGFLKRAEAAIEGQSDCTKGTGVLNTYDKTGATLINSRTISESGTSVTKT